MIQTYTARLDSSALPMIPRAWTIAFWLWAEDNRELLVLEVRVFLWRHPVRLRHLFPIFERIFGRPSTVGLSADIR